MTKGEAILREVLLRLRATTPSPLVPILGNIRRFHRTNVSKENAPAIHLIEGPDRPMATPKGCDLERELTFSVAIMTREDGSDEYDGLKEEVMRRLEATEDTPFAAGVRLMPPSLLPETEVADTDANRIELEFKAKYVVNGWTLS